MLMITGVYWYSTYIVLFQKSVESYLGNITYKKKFYGIIKNTYT